MLPIRADHGPSRRKGEPHAGVAAVGSAGGELEERAKQPQRSAPSSKRHSPNHPTTPSPNQQAPSSPNMAVVHATTHGHVFAHGDARRTTSSKEGNPSGGSSRNVFDDDVNSNGSTGKPKGYSHAHSQRGLGSKSPAFGPPFKGPSARGGAGPQQQSSWGVYSPTPGVGVGGSRANSSPTPPPGSSGSGSARGGHCSPTFGRGCGGSDVALEAQAHVASLSSHLSAPSSTVSMPPDVTLGLGSAGAPSLPPAALGSAAEAREMTQLDRVFLEQPHEGRQDVNNEIQRHLESRVQSQQSQLAETMKTMNRNSSSSSVGGGGGVGEGGAGGGPLGVRIGGVGGMGKGGGMNGATAAAAATVGMVSGGGGGGRRREWK